MMKGRVRSNSTHAPPVGGGFGPGQEAGQVAMPALNAKMSKFVSLSDVLSVSRSPVSKQRQAHAQGNGRFPFVVG